MTSSLGLTFGKPDTLATVGLCDAVGIALEIFRKPITNSIMLGAFARTTGVVSLEALKQGLESANLRDAGLRQNIEAVERGYQETVVHDLEREAPS